MKSHIRAVVLISNACSWTLSIRSAPIHTASGCPPADHPVYMQQVQDNINTYEENKPLNAEEMELILGIADEMIAKTTVPCTGCHYCVTKCPKQLDIPFLLKLYNEAMVAGSGMFIAPMALASVDADKQPECCINCHSCEKVCPQIIHIPEELAKFAKKMER